jgi:hypothetical protein
VTYLIRDAAQDQRSLLTLYSGKEVSSAGGSKEDAPQSYTTEKSQIQIVGYDEIIPTLYGNRYVRGRYYMWKLRQQGQLPPGPPPRPVQPPAGPPPVIDRPEAQEGPEKGPEAVVAPHVQPRSPVPPPGSGRPEGRERPERR